MRATGNKIIVKKNVKRKRKKKGGITPLDRNHTCMDKSVNNTIGLDLKKD